MRDVVSLLVFDTFQFSPKSSKSKFTISLEIAILGYQAHFSLNGLPNNDTVKGVLV
jgi:hypothetical protein